MVVYYLCVYEFTFLFFLSSDLSSISSLHIVVIDVFGSPNEELRSAASYSLGRSIVT